MTVNEKSVVYRAQFVQFSMVFGWCHSFRLRYTQQSFPLSIFFCCYFLFHFNNKHSQYWTNDFLYFFRRGFFSKRYCTKGTRIIKAKSMKLHRLAEQIFNVLCIRLRFAMIVQCTIKSYVSSISKMITVIWPIVGKLTFCSRLSFWQPFQRKIIIIVYIGNWLILVKMVIEFKHFDNNESIYLVQIVVGERKRR